MGRGSASLGLFYVVEARPRIVDQNGYLAFGHRVYHGHSRALCGHLRQCEVAPAEKEMVPV